METAREGAPQLEPVLSKAIKRLSFLYFHISIIFSPIQFLFLSYINVQVSLPVIYLQLLSLPTSSIVVTLPATITLPANPTCPVFIIISFIILTTHVYGFPPFSGRRVFIILTTHVSRFPPFSGGRALPLDICCINRVINSVFLQRTLEFLCSKKQCKEKITTTTNSQQARSVQ